MNIFGLEDDVEKMRYLLKTENIAIISRISGLVRLEESNIDMLGNKKLNL